MRALHPWHLWTDGNIHDVFEGTHFTAAGYNGLRVYLYQQAATRGMRILVSVSRRHKMIRFQFCDPQDYEQARASWCGLRPVRRPAPVKPQLDSNVCKDCGRNPRCVASGGHRYSRCRLCRNEHQRQNRMADFFVKHGIAASAHR